MRFLTGDTHPDHDSICKFRRENKDLLSDAFHQVLELAARARVLQVGDFKDSRREKIAHLIGQRPKIVQPRATP